MDTTESKLWVLTGTAPCDWELPLFVNESGDFWDVKPASYLLSPQRDALDLRLSAAGAPMDGFWSVNRDWLKANARRVPPGEPENFVVWGRKKNRIIAKSKRTEERAELHEFLDALFKKKVAVSRADLEVQWFEFCTHMVHWLAVERKPVDLYFIKLHPIPYRQNWKHILLSRFPKVGRFFSGCNSEQREMMLKHVGFTDEMVCLDLLSLDKSDLPVPIVEVEHRMSWWESVKKAETARRLDAGKEVYAKRYMQWIRGSIPTLVRLYGAWLAQIARPSASALEGKRAGRFSFAPNFPKGKYPRNKPPSALDIPPVVFSKPPEHSGFSEPEDLLGSDAVLSSVSPVSQTDEDVRLAGKTVDGQTSGVPVLPAGEKQDES